MSKTCLFTDPPFACRTEPLSFTLKTIAQRYKKLNSIYHVLPIFWVFPYFMENYIHNVMPEMDMMDYLVNYTNHKHYHSGVNGRKEGSPIRIFTNIPLNLIPLPISEGYRYCKLCEKFTFKENVHCRKCGECPSKNGSKYLHCELCALCVKPNYKHCKNCDRCTQVEKHDCASYQSNITCWICLTKGHNEVNCEKWAKLNRKTLGIKRKSLKTAKKICFLCNVAGHNERKCKQRKFLLKEETFLGEVCNIFNNK